MSLRVKCPRCSKYITAHPGDAAVECNCHLICPEGTKPSDCTITAVSGSYRYNWPKGVHGGVDDESDNEHAVTQYCSVHDYRFSKAEVVVPVDWSKLTVRAAARERYFGEGTNG